jgi:type VI protein secretion system component VasK
MPQANAQLKTALVVAGSVLLSGIAILLVWFFLPPSIGVAGKLVLSLLLLLPLPVIVLVRHLLKRRAASLPTDAAAAPQAMAATGKNKKTALPAPTGTYEELTRAAEEAVQWLRNTKLGGDDKGDKRAAEAAVYALPWIAVSGPRASGKTSLLVASEFNFHVLPESARLRAKHHSPDCQQRLESHGCGGALRHQRTLPDRRRGAR